MRVDAHQSFEGMSLYGPKSATFI